VSNYDGIAKWMLIASLRGILFWPKKKLSSLLGGPMGFLDAQQCAALARWPGIRRVEPVGEKEVLVVVDGGYDGKRGSIDVEVLYAPLARLVVLREQHIFDNAHVALQKRASANHWPWDEKAIHATAASYGCVFARGGVSVSAEGQPDAGTIAEAALRVASACRAIAGLAG